MEESTVERLSLIGVLVPIRASMPGGELDTVLSALAGVIKPVGASATVKVLLCETVLTSVGHHGGGGELGATGVSTLEPQGKDYPHNAC
jgi:hypothetical protein